MKKHYFTKGVERLIDPINVGTIHFLQFFNSLLPKSIQRKIVESSSQKTPSMGFVVEPYSYFLCYEIEDIEKAKELIPDGFELVKTKIFKDDKPKYYSIFGCINTHTSAFYGLRVEFYIIAEDIKTGLLSWIIIDYDSNTISYDKKNALKSPNSSGSVITTNYDGILMVDVHNNDNQRKLVFESDIKKGIMKPLDQRLWLEGNLSIGYGKNVSLNDPYIFGLKFDPLEFKQALEMPIDSLNMEINTWFPGLIKDKPSQLACFPYAQHFISDSPGFSSQLKTKEELVKAVNKVDFSNIKVFSTKSFKTMFIVGSIISTMITLILLILLIID